jgi:ABC-type amino acid transport substrate-binding protein
LIRAVATDSIDVAVAWGPLAGYFAKRLPARLAITPVTTARGRSGAPDSPGTTDDGFAYSMSLGVRRGDSAWRAMLDAELTKRRDDIRRILEEYGVPLVAAGDGRHR